MKYGIAIFPSKKLQDLANSYRKRYDPHYRLIPPHITLKEAFNANDDDIKVLADECKKIAQETKPFALRVYKVSSFHPVTNTIHLKVEKNNELVILNEKLHAGKFTEEFKYSFVPHITIGQKLSDDEHGDVLERLKMMNINHEETVDRFQLLYQLEDEQWTVYETFRLGKEQ
jgi:2'-5' RNA ligase